MDLLRGTVAVARRAGVTTLAGSLAYFAFVSLVPLGVLVVLVVATVAGEPTGSRALAATTEALEPGVGTLIESTVRDARGRFGATLVGGALLVFGVGRLFHGLEGGFAAVYAERRERSAADALRDAAVVGAADVAALSAVALAAARLPFAVSEGWLAPVGTLALFCGLVVAVLPTFVVFPEPDVGVREALPGAALSALAWTLATVAVRWYAAAGGGWRYGALGVVLLALAWLYVGGLCVLVGAALNAVRGGHVSADDAWVADYL
ncbi:YihY/virulence factor BrkB family protein [Halosegnis marinus]|uniref:YihY/virulence factor BrkB family protein n=1 Tax=Halosegnis marinus TaxID=3034023 RepID=A0ABD5ZP82_9EURY|nr:YhjD/YihY/BrkB family envelope integrity protein [Halosegnis sp. DT85]